MQFLHERRFRKVVKADQEVSSAENSVAGGEVEMSLSLFQTQN